MMTRCLGVVLVCLLLALAPGCGSGATGESAGVSAAGLERIDAAAREEIEAGHKAGLALLIARHGDVVYERAFGEGDIGADLPLRTDSYFRMFSMTKPIVSVALLMLYEEGHFQLDDPLATYAPAMADVMVYAGEDERGRMTLETTRRPITIRDVFRHTAGFSYGVSPGESASDPVATLYRDRGVSYMDMDSVSELVEEKLPHLPLLFQPGARWHYSFAHDVQAWLVEHFSGMPIDQFLRERIFEPLKMDESFYGEPQPTDPRRTVVYTHDEQGRLVEAEALMAMAQRFGTHHFGGAGLTMTMHDYARFCQMLLNEGELDGVRILERGTVGLMRSNHLAPGESIAFFPGFGYGLGVSVCYGPEASGTLCSEGQFGWGGAASTWMFIDPEEDLIAVICAQHQFDATFLRRFERLIYQSLE